MEAKIKLSIITVNLNNTKGLQKTIDSVINQTCPDFEWIVIDGSSSDGSRELIEKFSDHIDYWVSEPDNGIYNAMNKGILKSHGEYLLFLNSGDSLFDINVIEKLNPLLKTDEIYMGYQERSGTIYKIDADSPQKIYDVLHFTGVPHQSSILKRSLFDKYGLYREDKVIVSDWWLFYQALVLGNANLVLIPMIISNFNSEGMSQGNDLFIFQEKESLIKENPYIEFLHNFYINNRPIISLIYHNRLTYNLFKVVFIFPHTIKQLLLKLKFKKNKEHR